MGNFWKGIVRWCNDDVIGIAYDHGIEMSLDDAEQWWNEHESGFKTLMVEYGNSIIAEMIES